MRIRQGEHFEDFLSASSAPKAIVDVQAITGSGVLQLLKKPLDVVTPGWVPGQAGTHVALGGADGHVPSHG